MSETVLQIIGYVASGIIAISMTMNSIVKFRWINLVGASSFGIYGIMIGAIPVVILNSFIVSVDIFYLIRIYNKKELFDILEVRGDNKYLLKMLDFYKDDINNFFPIFTYKPELNTISFLILRNTAVAGIFLAHIENDDTLKIGLDYVVPQYRDYKNGKYIFPRIQKRLVKRGIKKAVTTGVSEKHEKYLNKMGFTKNSDGSFVYVYQ